MMVSATIHRDRARCPDLTRWGCGPESTPRSALIAPITARTRCRHHALLLITNQRRTRAITSAQASTTARMIELEISPARMASPELEDAFGMVAGSITATNTTPRTRGMNRPVTDAVLRIVTTSATISPIRNRSLSCESTRSITTTLFLPLDPGQGLDATSAR